MSLTVLLLKKLGIRSVGTFPLRGIQGEEKITEISFLVVVPSNNPLDVRQILPRTLRDRQFAPVGVDVPQSPTAAVAKEMATKQVLPVLFGQYLLLILHSQLLLQLEDLLMVFGAFFNFCFCFLIGAQILVVMDHETPGAQFAKFAEIHEPLPHVPTPTQPSLHPSSTTQNPATLQQHLSVSIPSPSDTPIPSPSGTPFIESMESLTNSLLSSMSFKSLSTHAVTEAPAEDQPEDSEPENGKRFPFTPAPVVSHPDDIILQKHEEKLKNAEEKLIRLKSNFLLMDSTLLFFNVHCYVCLSKQVSGDLARVKTEKDEARDKLKGLKDTEKTLKNRYLDQTLSTMKLL